MTLTAKDVAEITRLLEASNFDELYLELDGLKLSLRRGAALANAQPLGVVPAFNGAAPATPAAGHPAPASALLHGNLPAAAAPSATAASPATTAPPATAPPPVTTARPATASHSATTAPRATAAQPAPISSPALDPDAVDVLAPLLGTFYRAPKPGAPAFVEVGSLVEEDTIIGIIEVMKLMNTVRAGVRGKVTQILGRDGTLVEYGEILMRVGR